VLNYQVTSNHISLLVYGSGAELGLEAADVADRADRGVLSDERPQLVAGRGSVGDSHGGSFRTLNDRRQTRRGPPPAALSARSAVDCVQRIMLDAAR